MQYPHAAATVALPLLLSISPLFAAENQLIDDFWMKGSAPRQAEPARPAKTPGALHADAPGKVPGPAPAGSPTKALAPVQSPAPPQAQVPTNDAVPAATPEPASNRIRPNDRLSVEVLKVDELSVTRAVNQDGQILMPLIGAVEVAGLTTEEAEQRIEEILGRDYLQDPRVRIRLAPKEAPAGQGEEANVTAVTPRGREKIPSTPKP